MSAFHAFILNSSTLFFWCFTIHFWYHCGPSSHDFRRQHCLPSCPRNSSHHLSGRIYLKFFGLFGEHVHILSFDCSLVSAFTNETQASSPVTLMNCRNALPSLSYHSKRQSQSHSLCFVCIHEHFQNPSHIIRIGIRVAKL
jgi:hypothetical protein